MTTMAMPKTRRDSGMEGLVAKWYAANTAEMMKEFADLAQRVAWEITDGSSVLEVAPGPGYFCLELAKLGQFEITGLDLSRTFVKMATKKAAAAGARINFQQGSASNMPFPKNSFDFLVCRAAFKNFAKPVEALKEMCRVLKPGGHGLIIDLKGDASRDEIGAAVDEMHLSGFNRLVTRLALTTFLLKRAYTRAQFEQMLGQAGFSSFAVLENSMGLEISMTK